MSAESLLCQYNIIPYSRKYWQELNLAVEPKINIARIHVYVDLNLVVWYGITIRIHYMQVGNFGGF